jgi:hypothetical protein
MFSKKEDMDEKDELAKVNMPPHKKLRHKKKHKRKMKKKLKMY